MDFKHIPGLTFKPKRVKQSESDDTLYIKQNGRYFKACKHCIRLKLPP
jgi:hypothetical protein